MSLGSEKENGKPDSVKKGNAEKWKRDWENHVTRHTLSLGTPTPSRHMRTEVLRGMGSH
jgi:hypothetical protein